MATKAKPTAKIPKVRLAKPTGRPYQIRYFCPVEKRELRISTNTHDEAEANEQKKSIEAKLRLGIEVTPRKPRGAEGPHMSWEDFRSDYTRLKLSTFRSECAALGADLAIDMCTKIIKPRTLADMAKPATLAKLQAELLAGAESPREKARSPHTVKSYMATLIAALNWAHRPMKWLPDAIEFDKLAVDDPKRGRAITTEEFERLLAAVPKVVDEADAESWRYLLRGLWESGLRLSEALNVSWDIEGAILPTFPKRGLPTLHIPAKLQKNRKAQDVPTTPAFAALLLETPTDARTGYVFNPVARRGSSD